MYSYKREKYNNKILVKNTLYGEYITNKLKILDICKKYKVTVASIYRKLKKYNISLRGIDHNGKNNPCYGSKRPDMQGKNNPVWNSKLIQCPICQKKFYCNIAKIKKVKNICCSFECSCKLKSILYKGKNNPNFNNWSSFEPYPLGWTKTFKEQIRFRDNYKCQLCGCPEVECNKKLHIHHIDYNKNNILPNNLISLCGSCHMKTNGNREYWIKLFKELQNVHV